MEERFSGGTKTILVAEDDDSVRLLARVTLQSAGYAILEARDGEEALSIYSENASKIALLLTDVAMPRMGGKALVSHLRKHRPELRVILMSGFAGDALTAAGALEGGIEFIQKPFHPDALARIVHAALASTAE